MRTLLLIATLLIQTVAAESGDESYDYFASNRVMIRNGMQAVMMCNGLFTSHRNLQQIFSQELMYLSSPRFGGAVGDMSGGDYAVDDANRWVSVGGSAAGPTIRAAFRPGIGCVVMAPGESDINQLPELTLAKVDEDKNTIPWPDGDLIEEESLPDNIDKRALLAASDWAFQRDTPEQDTLSLIVVYRGHIIHERYANGITASTRTRTWSVAKSIAVTLIGLLVDRGAMSLDAALGIDWRPLVANPQNDPRNKITLRHLLNMSSGLYPVDNFGMEYATGSGLAYWAGASSIEGMRDRGLIRSPGTYWDYENYDTLLAVYAMKQALGDDKTYQEFPRRALLDKIGMNSTLVGTDRFHDFILSSQVYSTARDLARLGLLYQQNGLWKGKRLLSEEWIRFVRTPAPATRARGSFYGGQWWLVPDGRNDIPKDAYSAAGNRGQYVIVVPSQELVIVRRGLDFGKQGFDRWDLTREVLKAVLRE